jgi:flagellar biosynthesis protein FlhA
LTDEQGSISVLTLATQIEDFIRESIQKTEHGTYLNLEPNLAQRIIESIQQSAEKVSSDGLQPIILCSPIVRRHVRHLLERFMPHVIILSNNELSSQTKIKSLGTIEVNQKKK